MFKKIDGEWLITMDYDSIEGGSIGLKDFEKAYAMNDIDKFIKQG
ncbi:hypothetical protein [Winogradskyella alexanderae]|nr:hypothetical protein [Winogradskyella alexanderae]